jgi:thymidylate synthase (FAD)
MEKYYERDKLEFLVNICPLGSSPHIQEAIWDGQHVCVTDKPEQYYANDFNPWDAARIVDEERAGNAVIKHQLNVEHYSVLNMAFVKFNVYGFPHSTMQQIRTHRDSAFLVSSMRYTGEKFLKVASMELDVREAFYVRPPGNYRDRTGRTIKWTDEHYEIELDRCLKSCRHYSQLVVDENAPYEHAREYLMFNYRQPFVIAGTVEALFHWLDQRSKKDSEREIQILAQMCINEFCKVAPELGNWYLENRWSKARLAP